jgi:hypothetical protein
VILPAPNGPIYTLLRLYSAQGNTAVDPAAGEGTWKPPAVMQVQ